ncbi:hypothetical protein [Bdellovibrio sp. HCB337]|uniref:hypothetical protein n=1 Tax=Bdellovibrio sp. HCB337 TaxID=3394358 RepID=UPI0039A48873
MLKIIIAGIFAAQTSFAGISKNVPPKANIPGALNIAVAYNNASADAESLINIISITNGKPQEAEEFKQHLGVKGLKQKPLKFKRQNDGNYVSGKNTLAMMNGKIHLNGKEFSYDKTHTLLANFKKFQTDMGQKKTTSLLDILVPQAHAQYEDYDGPSPILILFLFGAIAGVLVAIFEGGGGAPMAIAGTSIAGAAAAGVGAAVYSGETMASESHIPTGLCQKKGNVITNTTAHVTGDTITQDYETKDGQLVITEKVNGEVSGVTTVAKKGEAYEVVKVVANGKSEDPTKHPMGKLGEYFFKSYTTCLNPTKEETAAIEKVNQVGADAKAGKIKLFPPGTKAHDGRAERKGAR